MTAQQTKISELLSQDNAFTSVRVSKTTLNELAKRGKFRDTFEDIIQRMIAESDDKLQAT
jgi:predicted XRE-type DNA-binding protein